MPVCILCSRVVLPALSSPRMIMVAVLFSNPNIANIEASSCCSQASGAKAMLADDHCNLRLRGRGLVYCMCTTYCTMHICVSMQINAANTR